VEDNSSIDWWRVRSNGGALDPSPLGHAFHFWVSNEEENAKGRNDATRKTLNEGEPKKQRVGQGESAEIPVFPSLMGGKRTAVQSSSEDIVEKRDGQTKLRKNCSSARGHLEKT